MVKAWDFDSHIAGSSPATSANMGSTKVAVVSKMQVRFLSPQQNAWFVVKQVARFDSGASLTFVKYAIFK